MVNKKGSRRDAERQENHPWTLKPVSANAHREWQNAREQEPDLVEKVHERLTSRPLDRSDNPRRTHQLQGSLGVKWVGGKQLTVWQHEFSSRGRVWYCSDKDAYIVWLVKMTLTHAKETD